MSSSIKKLYFNITYSRTTNAFFVKNITPLEGSKSFISNIIERGFTVKENDNGNSVVDFVRIAVATKKAENVSHQQKCCQINLNPN